MNLMTMCLFKLSLIFYFVLFLATSGLTFCIYRYANTLRLVAIADERSSHQGIVATGGGLAIAVSFLFVMGLGFYQQRFPVPFFKALLGGGLLLAVIGFWDDIKPLPIRFRMGWQCVAAFWAIYWLGEFPPILMGGWQLYLGHLASVVTFLAILWFINLYNFMDGIDGLAGTQAVTTAVSMAVIAIVNQQPNQVWLLMALAVMVAGFLVWNGSRARIIIMGDVGAGFLGYVFAVIFLHNSQQSSSLFWVFIILFAIFLVDATLTLLRRVFVGEPFYQPHRTHGYQMLTDYWRSHQKVTMLVLLVNWLWLLPLALLANQYPKIGCSITLLALCPIVIGWVYLQSVLRLKVSTPTTVS